MSENELPTCVIYEARSEAREAIVLVARGDNGDKLLPHVFAEVFVITLGDHEQLIAKRFWLDCDGIGTAPAKKILVGVAEDWARGTLSRELSASRERENPQGPPPPPYLLTAAQNLRNQLAVVGCRVPAPVLERINKATLQSDLRTNLMDVEKLMKNFRAEDI